MSKQLEVVRWIVVDEVRYGWKVTHDHIPGPAPGERLCVEHFLAFREGTVKAPLRIFFTAGPGGCHLDHGGVFAHALQKPVNLHLPRTVTALIRRAVELGWPADQPMTVDEGFDFLSTLPPEVLSYITEPFTPAAKPA